MLEFMDSPFFYVGMVVLLLALIGAFFYMRNKRPED